MVQRYGGMCLVVGGRKDSGCFIRQVYLETSRLAGCLTPVGIMGELLYSCCWEGSSCSASWVQTIAYVVSISGMLTFVYTLRLLMDMLVM